MGRLDQLADHYDLTESAANNLSRLVGLLASDPSAPTTIRSTSRILDDHIADSLVGLDAPSWPRRLRSPTLAPAPGCRAS